MRRQRLFLSILLIGAVVFNGVWHVAYADFHTHTSDPHASSPIPAMALDASQSEPNIDHGGDQVVHPVHQQAYLYCVQLFNAPAHTELSPEYSRAPALPAWVSGPFRPPSLV